MALKTFITKIKNLTDGTTPGEKFANWIKECVPEFTGHVFDKNGTYDINGSSANNGQQNIMMTIKSEDLNLYLRLTDYTGNYAIQDEVMLTVNREGEEIVYMSIIGNQLTYNASKTDPTVEQLSHQIFLLYDKDLITDEKIDMIKMFNSKGSSPIEQYTNLHRFSLPAATKAFMSNLQIDQYVCENTYVTNQGYYPYGTIVEDVNGNQFQNIGGFLFYKIA